MIQVMEFVLGLTLIPLAIALLIAPILAWVTYFRTGRFQREFKDLKNTSVVSAKAIQRLEEKVVDQKKVLRTLEAALADLQAGDQVRVVGSSVPDQLSVPEEPAATAVFEDSESAAIASVSVVEDEAAANTTVAAENQDEIANSPVVEELDAVEEGVAEPALEAKAPPIPIEATATGPLPTVMQASAERISEPADTEETKALQKDRPETLMEVVSPSISEPHDSLLTQREGETATSELEMLSISQLQRQRKPPAHEKEEEKTTAALPDRPQRLRKLLARLDLGSGSDTVDWETRIGQNWLNILGIVVLVVGLVLLIQQSLILLAPLGKILIGLGVSVALLVFGAWLGRRPAYRVFAFTLIGGGWGLLYFTAYAAHNIEAARIIENEYLAMLALLAVGGGILLQSFTYGRQSVTGLAYGLAFLALHLSPVSFYSLVATAVLAATIPFVIRRTDWRYLGVAISFATYATHARWLWATSLAASPDETTLVLGGLAASQAFWGNLGILVVYWTAFCAAAIVRKPEDSGSTTLDLATSMINMVGFIGLAAWQFETYLPGNLHYLAPPAIVAYAATAIVDGRMHRPILSRLNGTIAVVLFAVALPIAIIEEGLSWNWLAPYWAVGAWLVWELARRLDLPLYRGQAYVVGLLAVAASVGFNLSPTMAQQSWTFLLLGLAPILPVQRMLEYLNRVGAETPGANALDRALVVAGIVVLPLVGGLALWSAVPDHVAGLSMLAVAVVLLESGLSGRRAYLRNQGYILGLAGAVSVLVLNVIETPSVAAQEVQAVLFASAALCYAGGLRLRFSEVALREGERNLAWVSPGFATLFMAGGFIWLLPPEQVQIAWIVWAGIMLEAGQRLRWKEIRFQSYALMVAAAMANMMLRQGTWAGVEPLSPWYLTLAVAMLLQAATLRMIRPAQPLTSAEKTLAAIPMGAGLLFFAIAAWDFLPSGIAALVWAIWALGILETGQRLQRSDIRFEAHALLLAAALVTVALQPALQPALSTESAPASEWYLTFSVAMTLHLATLRTIFPARALPKPEDRLATAPLAVGVGLFALAAWDVLPDELAALPLALWALLLFEGGLRIGRADVERVAGVAAVAAFGLGVAVNIYGLFEVATLSDTPNWPAPLTSAIVLYAIHFRSQHAKRDSAVPELFRGGLFLHLATLMVALVLWRELPSVAVAVAWGALAFLLLEVSDRVEPKVLAQQAQVVLLAAVIRLFFANFIVPGEALGISHRLVTVAAVIALVYYMRALLVAGEGKDVTLLPAPVFSWIGAGLLVVLARFEVGREYAVAIWSVLILVFAYLGTHRPDRDFRYQAYVICGLVFGRVWSTNVYLEGSIWGLSERVVTSLPSLAALLTVVLFLPRSFEPSKDAAQASRFARLMRYADEHARSVVALLFASQLTLLVYHEVPIDLVSIGWAVSALFLLGLGFVLKERSLRLFGLGLLFVCLLKVVFIDLEGVETIYRVFSFIVLGLVLLAVSFAYSRFREMLGKFL